MSTNTVHKKWNKQEQLFLDMGAEIPRFLIPCSQNALHDA